MVAAMLSRLLLLPILTVAMSASDALAAAATRQITLQASPGEVTFGDQVTLSGQISGPPETPAGCLAGVEVVIRRWGPTDIAPPPPDEWPELGRTTSNATGGFAFTFEPGSNASYAAHVPPESPAGCDGDVSEEVGVSVRALVTIRVGDRTVPRGQKAKFTVQVRPHCQSFEPEVRLEQQRGSGFVTIAREEPRDPERCAVKFQERVRRSGRYRGATDDICHFACPYEAGQSRAVRVIVRLS